MMIERFENSLNTFKKKKYALFVSYSLIFGAVVMACFWYFLYNHKTMINDENGLSVHYVAMLYCSHFYKSILRGLISAHSLIIPAVDESLGIGTDIIKTMQLYGLTDPFSLLTAIVPEGHLDKFYCLLYLLKLYIAGAGVVLFARYHKASRLGSIAGAIFYCFSFWGVYYCLKDYNNMAPFICFPYAVLGVDKFLEKKKLLLLYGSLIYAGLSSYYVFGRILLFAIVYGCIVSTAKKKGFSINKLVAWLERSEKKGMAVTVFAVALLGAAYNYLTHNSVTFSWCVALVGAYIAAMLVTQIKEVSAKQSTCLVISVIIYVIITSISTTFRTKESMSLNALLIAEVLLFMLILTSKLKQKIHIVLLFMIIFSVSAGSYFRFSENGTDGGMSRYLNFSQANKMVAANAGEYASGFYEKAGSNH